ncbi:hypothetical protein ACQWF5_25060, partial [Salmonella enterica subsp. enterica serovar Infantis]
HLAIFQKVNNDNNHNSDDYKPIAGNKPRLKYGHKEQNSKHYMVTQKIAKEDRNGTQTPSHHQIQAQRPTNDNVRPKEHPKQP